MPAFRRTADLNPYPAADKKKRKNDLAWLGQGPYARGAGAANVPIEGDPNFMGPLQIVNRPEDAPGYARRQAELAAIAGSRAQSQAAHQQTMARIAASGARSTAEHERKMRIGDYPFMTPEEQQNILANQSTRLEQWPFLSGQERIDATLAQPDEPKIEPGRWSDVKDFDPAMLQNDFQQEVQRQGLNTTDRELESYRKWRNIGGSHVEWFNKFVGRKHAEGLAKARVAILENAVKAAAAGEKITPAMEKYILTGEYGGGEGTFGKPTGKLTTADVTETVLDEYGNVVQRGQPGPEDWQQKDLRYDVRKEVETSNWTGKDGVTIFGSVPVDPKIAGRYYEKDGKVYESIDWALDNEIGRLATQEELDARYQVMLGSLERPQGGAGMQMPGAQQGNVGETQNAARAKAIYLLQQRARKGDAKAQQALKQRGMTW